VRSTPYGIQHPPDPAARAYWDEHLEHNELRTNKGPETSAARLVALRLENAGDMLREMGQDPSDLGYFMEKLNRITNSLDDSDWRMPLYSTEVAKIKDVREQVLRIPAATEVTRAIIQVMLDVLDRNTASLGNRLEQLKQLIKSEPTRESSVTMDEPDGYEPRPRRGTAAQRIRKQIRNDLEAGLRSLRG